MECNRGDNGYSSGAVMDEPIPYEPPKAEIPLFEPLYNYILVKILDKGEMSAGRIIIPQTATIYDQAAKHAEVIACGCGHRTVDGRIIPLKVKPGDRIYFASLAGAEIRLGGEKYLITREEEIFGIVRA